METNVGDGEAMDDLIADISRDVVAEIAPEELPIFDENKEHYLRDPDGAAARQEGRDEALGFGLPDAVPFVAPVVVAVVSEVVKSVARSVLDAVKKEAGVAIAEWVKKLFKRFRHDEDGPPSLSREQLLEVRNVAVEKALALRLSRDRAETLADALVGTLATN